MTDLFNLDEITSPSPKLQWMEKHGLSVRKPALDEDAARLDPAKWLAWKGAPDEEPNAHSKAAAWALAETEEEALFNLALLLEIPFYKSL